MYLQAVMDKEKSEANLDDEHSRLFNLESSESSINTSITNKGSF